MTAATPQTDYAHADVGLVHALPMEVNPFWDRCTKTRKYSGGDFVFRGGRYGEGDAIRVAAVQTGIGFARARRATEALIDAHTPSWVVSCGFSGALDRDLKVGNIVTATEIVDTHGNEVSLDVNMPEDREAGCFVGKILTADEMVREVAQKVILGEQTGALAVDMESLAVAQVCRERKTPFMAVRVISDDMSADLPPEVLSVMGSTGTVRFGAAIGAVWKRPESVKQMWHLRSTAARAAENLASFLDGVVTQLYQAGH